MTLKTDYNKEAVIIWDTLFCCELYTLFRNNVEEERVKFIKKTLPTIKGKRYAHTSLKRVMRSGVISQYVDQIQKEMTK